MGDSPIISPTFSIFKPEISEFKKHHGSSSRYQHLKQTSQQPKTNDMDNNEVLQSVPVKKASNGHGPYILCRGRDTGRSAFATEAVASLGCGIQFVSCISPLYLNINTGVFLNLNTSLQIYGHIYSMHLDYVHIDIHLLILRHNQVLDLGVLQPSYRNGDASNTLPPKSKQNIQFPFGSYPSDVN